MTKFTVGDWLDVWCHRTRAWYPAKVIRADEKLRRIKVHFYKWQKRFDEWIHMVSHTDRQTDGQEHVRWEPRCDAMGGQPRENSLSLLM